MEVDIIFLNAWKYKDKKTGDERCAFEYYVNNGSSILNTDKQKGVKPATYWLDTPDFFDKVKSSYALQYAKLVVEEVPSVYNPLRKQVMVKSIKFKDATYDL